MAHCSPNCKRGRDRKKPIDAKVWSRGSSALSWGCLGGKNKRYLWEGASMLCRRKFQVWSERAASVLRGPSEEAMASPPAHTALPWGPSKVREEHSQKSISPQIGEEAGRGSRLTWKTWSATALEGTCGRHKGATVQKAPESTAQWVTTVLIHWKLKVGLLILFGQHARHLYLLQDL